MQTRREPCNGARSELANWTYVNGRLVPMNHPVFLKKELQKVRVRWDLMTLYVFAAIFSTGTCVAAILNRPATALFCAIAALVCLAVTFLVGPHRL